MSDRNARLTWTYNDALQGVVVVPSKPDTYDSLVLEDYQRRHGPFLSERLAGRPNFKYDCMCGANHTVGAPVVRAGRDIV